jgi:hypothetical protein
MLSTGLGMNVLETLTINESLHSLYRYETVLKRWPIILTGIIDTIYRIDHKISVTLPSLAAGSKDAQEAEAKLAEGKAIIEKISQLKYDMARNRQLEYASFTRVMI